MQLDTQDLLGSETVLNLPLPPSAEHSLMAADALRHRGRLRLKVHGESMLPTLWPRAIVEIASCSVADAKPGEILLAMRGGRLFLHRFLRREEDGFVLRGDSMPGADPLFSNDALLGKLVSGSVAPLWRFFPARIAYRAIGFLLCYCGPMRRAVLHLHHRSQESWEMREACASQAVNLEA
jgi:hypothetical protein